MAGGASALKRGLFGYSKRSVLETLIDRDVMFGRAQQRLKAAEEELARTRAAVEAVRTELGERTRQADEDRARLETELEDARGRLGESRREVDARTEEVRAATARAGEMEVEVHRLTEELRLQQERPTAGEGEGERAFSSEELAGVVANAEQALASVFERARRGNEEQLREIDRARAAVEGQTEALNRWREEITAVTRSVRQSAEYARAQIEQTPSRLKEAMNPATESMTSISEWLAELARITERLGGQETSEPTSESEDASTPTTGTEAVDDGELDVTVRFNSSDSEDDGKMHEGLPGHFRWQ